MTAWRNSAARLGPVVLAGALMLASWGCEARDAEVEILPSPPPPASAQEPVSARDPAPDEATIETTPMPQAPALRAEFIPFVEAWMAAPPAGWEASRVEALTAARADGGTGTEAEVRAGLELAAELLRLNRNGQALAAVQEAMSRQRAIWARETAAGIVSAESARQQDWLQPPFRLAARAGLRMAMELEALAPGRPQAARYPPGDTGVHDDPLRAGTTMSAARQILALAPGDPESQWHLTLAMALAGETGDGAGAGLDPTAGEAGLAVPFRFTAAALATDLQPAGPVGDVAAADFDGDGHADLLLAEMTPGPGLHLFMGSGDGSVRETTTAAGLADQLGATRLLAADADGDGDPDLLVLRGLALPGGLTAPPSLLRNQGGRFTDVTRESGLGQGAVRDAAWLDADDDGHLDLCLVQAGGARLWRQTGPLTFAETTQAAGLADAGPPFTSILSADVNGDGHADIYIWGRQGDRLFLGSGQGTFTARDGPLGPWPAAGPACFLDVEGDGRLDLFVAPATDNAWPDGAHPRLLLSRDGGWTDGTAAAGLAAPLAAAAVACVDLNGDGSPEIYAATADRDRDLFLPHALWLNEGGRFRRITRAVGGGLVLPGRAVAPADLDGDGLRDLIVLTGSGRLARARVLVLLRQEPVTAMGESSGSR